MTDFRQRLESEMAACIRDNRLTPPPPAIIEQLISLGLQLQGLPLYFAPFPSDREPPHDLDRRFRKAYLDAVRAYDLETEHLQATTPKLRDDAVIQSVLAYLKHWPGGDSGPFSVRYADAVDIARVSYELMEPLRSKELRKVEAFKPVLHAFHENAMAVSRRQLKRQAEGPIYPQDYIGPRDNIPDVYFSGTPFRELLEARVPFPLFDSTRYEANFVAGKKGTGKSNFLSHLINYDLKRLPEVSILFMDSQGEMIPKFARLPGLDPILIGPRHPAPLNPFYLGSIEQTLDALQYVLGASVDADFTSLQLAPLWNVVRAVAQGSEPTLRKVEEFFTNPDQDLIAKTDDDTRDYFKSPAWKKLNENTRAGILQRIALFRANRRLWDMVNADGCLDLDAQFKRGSFVLIDTNFDTRAQTRVFGRFFFALLDLATIKRRQPGYGFKRPVFVHVDELPDYCPTQHDDEKFRDTLDKCRKQFIACTLAAQRADTSQIHPLVLAALQDSAIHTRCLAWHREEQRGDVLISVQGEPTKLSVPLYQWPRLVPEPPTPELPVTPSRRQSSDEPMDYSNP